jgi:hypothetical protein
MQNLKRWRFDVSKLNLTCKIQVQSQIAASSCDVHPGDRIRLTRDQSTAPFLRFSRLLSTMVFTLDVSRSCLSAPQYDQYANPFLSRLNAA